MKRCKRNFSEIATMLDERMTNLEEQYSELKNIVKQRATQNYIANPALLEHWNPGDMVIKHSPWTTMRLVLNKVAIREYYRFISIRLASKANHVY